MWWAVDLLASQYGGGPQEILDTVSLYDILCLVEKINERQVFKWRMQTTISAYPHYDKKSRKQFMNTLDRMSSEKRRKMQTEKLDKVGFEALKFSMSRNPRIVVK